MAALKSSKAGTSDKFIGRYRGKTTVYLEGVDDTAVYARQWFNNRLDRLDFQNPDAAPGCDAVIAKVADDRRAGLKAFGVVDRDALQAKRNWPLVWETDDDKFSAARPFGEHIRVTLYWEMESYLIHPEALEEYIANHEKGRLPRTRAEVVADLLRHAQCLIPHAAINAALHEEGKTECGDTFAKTDTRSNIEQKIEQSQRSRLTDKGWKNYRACIKKVEAFDFTDKPDEIRIAGLLRRIHGKALLDRIKKSANISHDITFHVAAGIKRRGDIPNELLNYVDEFCS